MGIITEATMAAKNSVMDGVSSISAHTKATISKPRIRITPQRARICFAFFIKTFPFDNFFAQRANLSLYRHVPRHCNTNGSKNRNEDRKAASDKEYRKQAANDSGAEFSLFSQHNALKTTFFEFLFKNTFHSAFFYDILIVHHFYYIPNRTKSQALPPLAGNNCAKY